jgi:hypothetical protein
MTETAQHTNTYNKIIIIIFIIIIRHSVLSLIVFTHSPLTLRSLSPHSVPVIYTPSSPSPILVASHLL